MGLLDAILPSFLGPVVNAVSTVVDRLVPDNNAAQKVKDEIAIELNKSVIAGQLAQLDINKVEAGSSSVFIAGWRPWIGWGCGTTFIINVGLLPLLSFSYTLWTGHPAPGLPQLDPVVVDVMGLLLGGTIGSRTYEKIKGVAS